MNTSVQGLGICHLVLFWGVCVHPFFILQLMIIIKDQPEVFRLQIHLLPEAQNQVMVTCYLLATSQVQC